MDCGSLTVTKVFNVCICNSRKSFCSVRVLSQPIQLPGIVVDTKAFIISMIPETLRNVSKMNARTIDAFRAMIRASLVFPCIHFMC
jgi:hypothetical protein